MCAVRLIFLKKYKKTIDISLLFCYYIQALSERHSSLAQSVEHSAVNRVVVGSSPTGGATNKKTGHRPVFLFVLFSFLAYTMPPRLTADGFNRFVFDRSRWEVKGEKRT